MGEVYGFDVRSLPSIWPRFESHVSFSHPLVLLECLRVPSSIQDARTAEMVLDLQDAAARQGRKDTMSRALTVEVTE